MVQSLQAGNYAEKEISDMLTKLHKEGVLSVSRGRFSGVRVA